MNEEIEELNEVEEEQETVEEQGGVQITDEQLDEISGGSWTHSCSDFEDDEWW